MRRRINICFILLYFVCAFLCSHLCLTRWIFFREWPQSYDCLLFGFAFLLLSAHYLLLFHANKKQPVTQGAWTALCVIDGIVFGTQLIFFGLICLFPLFGYPQWNAVLPVVITDAVFLAFRFGITYFVHQKRALEKYKPNWGWLMVILAVVLGCSIYLRIQPAYTLAQADSEITQIEIVEISDYDIIYRYNEFHRIRPIATVEQESWDDFLDEFQKMSRRKEPGGMPQILLEGTCIRITYRNGGFELIGPYGNLYYVSQTEKEESYHRLHSQAFYKWLAQYTE